MKHFHDAKSVFIDLDICSNFNIPKLHFCSKHYVPQIRYLGTTNNNTEYTKRLYIDYAKEAYARRRS